MRAALDGAREIGFTVISLTLSLIAVFIPLLFMTGLVGRMFREFALTLTIAVVVSAIVSLTLTPMMCARLLKRHAEPEEAAVSRGFNWGIDGIVERYRRTLEWVLRHQRATLLVTLPDARHHGLALHHRAEGLPARSGYGPDHRRARSRAAGLVHRVCSVQQQVADAVTEGSGGGRRRLGGWRRHAQHHAQRRAPQDHTKAAQ